MFKRKQESLNEVAGEFEQSIRMVREGISRYREVMQRLAKTGETELIRQLAERGIGTARKASEQWSAIADDLYVMDNT